MKETQRRLFKEYISYHQEHGRDYKEPLQMALVLGGEKPATTFKPPEELFSQYPDLSPQKLIKKWDLYYRPAPSDSALMVSSSPLWFDLLPTVDLDTEIGTRRYGLFFGYPFDAIDYFHRAKGAILPGRKYVSQDGFSAEDMAYSVFTFYRPEDSKTGYKRAIDTGKKRYSRLHELADEWDLQNLSEMTDQLHEDFTTRYSDCEFLTSFASDD